MRRSYSERLGEDRMQCAKTFTIFGVGNYTCTVCGKTKKIYVFKMHTNAKQRLPNQESC